MLEKFSGVSVTDIGLAVCIVLFSTLLDSLVVTGIVSFWTNAGVFGSIVLVCDGVEATIVDEIFEVLSVVRFILPGWLGAGDVSLDTLEALFAGAFAFSGWLGAGDPGRLWFQTVWVPLLMLFVELSKCVDAVVVVAFGVSLVFDARDDCVKIRQMQRQRNR